MQNVIDMGYDFVFYIDYIYDVRNYDQVFDCLDELIM